MNQTDTLKILNKYKILLIVILGGIFLALGTNDNIINFDQNDSKSDFIISVPKIDVKAPVLIGVDPKTPDVYQKELTKGVAHMVGTAMPGEKGNVFIYGHSSSEIKSRYDKIFEKLDELETNDEILVKYKQTRYNYVVSEKKIVEKDDFSVLEQDGPERVTLMTCWPLGTTDQRFIVVANRKI